MQQYLQNKKGLVQNVFNQVYDQYDLMNDFMSFGIHRLWKKNLIHLMNPSNDKKLIDVASGTGDIAKLYLNKLSKNAEVTCVDPNLGMIKKSKEKLKEFKNVNFIISPAEKIPLKDNSFDFYTISFGLRNTKDLVKALSEAYRVLKPGGRYLCLEFSKIQNSKLNFVYENYSKLIPSIGKLVVGEKEPYEYLIKSIDDFYNQNELSDKMKDAGFDNIQCRNLFYGVAAIHRGWKV